MDDENSSLQERLKTADDTLERQMKQIENLTLQLGEAERTLAEKEEDMESLDKASKDEVFIRCIFCRNLHVHVPVSKHSLVPLMFAWFYYVFPFVVI